MELAAERDEATAIARVSAWRFGDRRILAELDVCGRMTRWNFPLHAHKGGRVLPSTPPPHGLSRVRPLDRVRPAAVTGGDCGRVSTRRSFADILRYLREGRSLETERSSAPSWLAGCSPGWPARDPSYRKGENMLSPAGDNVSGRLPKTEAEAALLRPAISKLLRATPKHGGNSTRRTDRRRRQRSVLGSWAAGMAERRWYRTSILNHPTCFEVRFQATGEGGLPRAIEQSNRCGIRDVGRRLASMEGRESPDVLRRFDANHRRKSGDRRTRGPAARGDLDGTNPDAGFDTVRPRAGAAVSTVRGGQLRPATWTLLKPPQAGRPSKINARGRTGPSCRDLPCSGSGRTVELRTIQKPADDRSVNVANWTGANAFAAALGRCSISFLPSRQPSPRPPPQNADLATRQSEGKSGYATRTEAAPEERRATPELFSPRGTSS